MARSLWTGAISFGLVNVPVRLYSATRARELRFHLLHGKDDGRIHFRRVCSVDGAEVPQDEIVRAFEIHKGRFVRMEPEELEALHPKTTHAIELEAFVDLAEIDPVHFVATYHVAPEEGATRSYSLLCQAMEKAQKAGIARMVMRTKEYLCALRDYPPWLRLSTMLHADELVSPDDLGLPVARVDPRGRELDMAVQLIDSLQADWEPENYPDRYREQALESIRQKAGGEALVTPMEQGPAEVVNLADALAASLAARSRPPVEGHRRAPEASRPVPKRKGANKARRR